MMKRQNPVHIPAVLLCIAACCMAMVLPAAADSDCALDPRYPDAMFTCSLADPATRGSPFPEGPPYVVNCFDQSHTRQDIASWRWDFGDGGTSTRQSPAHTYADTGSYPITLTVTTICGSQYTDTSAGSIDVYCIPGEPQFVVDTDNGTAPLTVHVRDTSSFTPDAITRWTYRFDSTHKSTDKNPSFTYTKPGIYTISQTVTKDCVRPGLPVMPPFEKKINVTVPTFLLLYTLNITSLSTETPQPGSTPGALRASAQPPPTLVRTTSAGGAGSAAATTAPPVPQATAEPVPGTGTLSVTTDPAGAMVYIDEVLRGASPATIPNLPAGTHTLRLGKEGYRTLTVPVDISEAKTTEYSTALVPAATPANPLPLSGAAGILALAAAGVMCGIRKKIP